MENEPILVYATVEDLHKLYPSSTIDRLADIGIGGEVEIDYTVLDRGLINASSEINLYIGSRYTLPLLAPIPYSVTEWCCIICVYKRSTELDILTDERRLRYEDVIKTLKDVAKRIINIPNLRDSEIDNDGEHNHSNDDTYFNSSPRLFTRNRMRGL